MEGSLAGRWGFTGGFSGGVFLGFSLVHPVNDNVTIIRPASTMFRRVRVFMEISSFRRFRVYAVGSETLCLDL